MKRKGRLISLLCCIAAVGLLAGIYCARRMQSSTHIIVGSTCFAVAALALVLSVIIYISYYKHKY